MKAKRYAPLLLSLILLTSCSKAVDSGDVGSYIAVSRHQGIYNDIIIGIDRDEGYLYHTDLVTNQTLPICTQPNCSHEKGSKYCTARGENGGNICAPMIYGGNIYFVDESNGIRLYKCDLSGGNRRQVFSFSMEDGSGVKYAQPILFGVEYSGAKLFMLAQSGIMLDSDGGLGAATNSNLTEWTILCYDIKADKGSKLYATGFLVESMPVDFRLLSDGALHFGVRYNSNEDYGAMPYSELRGLIEDLGSAYYDTLVESYISINISSGDAAPAEAIDEVFSDGDFVYRVAGNALIRRDKKTGADKTVLESIAWIEGVHDNTLFVRADKNEVLFLENGDFVAAPLIWQIGDETLSYFLIYKDGRGGYAILKEDYYKGADTSFAIAGYSTP